MEIDGKKLVWSNLDCPLVIPRRHQLAISRESNGKHAVLMHHKVIISLILQVLTQSPGIEIPNLLGGERCSSD